MCYSTYMNNNYVPLILITLLAANIAIYAINVYIGILFTLFTIYNLVT